MTSTFLVQYDSESLRQNGAAINYNGRKKHLGAFLTPSDAAKAYDEAAKRLHGDFARMNGG